MVIEIEEFFVFQLQKCPAKFQNKFKQAYQQLKIVENPLPAIRKTLIDAAKLDRLGLRCHFVSSTFVRGRRWASLSGPNLRLKTEK